MTAAQRLGRLVRERYDVDVNAVALAEIYREAWSAPPDRHGAPSLEEPPSAPRFVVRPDHPDSARDPGKTGRR